jgi:hypothetical protein
VSFHADGHEPWITAGVSSDLNQAALMAIVDGFHYWLLRKSESLTGSSAPGEARSGETGARISAGVAS